MNSTTDRSDQIIDPTSDRAGIGGHPRGLTTLFFTEMWERFSYYGMRALLTLYMTATVANGGLGYDIKSATSIYGAYTGSVYLMSIPGGWIADNVLGTRNAVFYGGMVIALGHFSLAVPTIYTFYAGLILIVVGTGLLKPNVSALVGSLYSATDIRRDSGFSIFYMGINLGAFIAPLICSYLGEKINWHLGFGAAGIGMTCGLIQYYLGRERLAHVGHTPDFPKAAIKRNAIIGSLLIVAIGLVVIFLYFGPTVIRENKVWIMLGCVAVFLGWMFTSYLKPEEKKPIAVIVILFVFAIIFWASFEQAGSSFNLFADRFTDRTVSAPIANVIKSSDFPAGWFQSVGSIFLIILAPVFSLLWLKLGKHQPSSPAKFANGLLFVGLGAAFLIPASMLLVTPASKVGPWWLIGVYLLQTVGELCLSPVGLSTTTKLAPSRLVGLMMGVWFLSISLGNYLAGELAGKFGSGEALVDLFTKSAGIPIMAGIALFALTPFIRKMMGSVR